MASKEFRTHRGELDRTGLVTRESLVTALDAFDVLNGRAPAVVLVHESQVERAKALLAAMGQAMKVETNGGLLAGEMWMA